MKKVILLITLFTIAFTACTKEDPPAPVVEVDNQIVFWSDFQGEPITVYVNGNNIGTITAVGSSAPGCGSSGNITRTYSPGTYSFSATESGESPITWSGSFTIASDVSCLNYLLSL